jgi:serine/threonine protein kinase
MEIDEIVEKAMALGAEARDGYVAEACGGDERLLRAVQASILARAEPAADGTGPGEASTSEPATCTFAGREGTRTLTFTPSEPVGSSGRPPSEGPGSRIGPYTLVAPLGEGGMGSVFRAEQTSPVRRQVAVKIIKAGMDTEAVISRFEAERQALALMDHPNIARVLDAGATDSGRPFFVMELVEGPPITRYCDARRLDTRRRLELFIPLCQAIQHAHQKGIVHRDIKPSNVLVSEVDGRPVPKVIDFGIAKAIEQPLLERSQFTQVGAVVGTPEYMSPEQAGPGGQDVDTRADVYALGVLLYELLTGSTPLDRATLRGAAFEEILRRIREDEPPPPSRRLGRRAEVAGGPAGRPAAPEALTIAALRDTEPGRLTRQLRGDLDWVVMRCLEKDRGRRYESASALARDIERHLSDEPVEAGPPSASYRLVKLIRRNKTRTAAAGLLSLSLIGGIVGTTSGMREANRQALIARAELAAKEEARRAEALERGKAERRLAQVERGIGLLRSIFRELNPMNEEKGSDLRLQLAGRLEALAATIEGDALADEDLVAEMQSTLGASLEQLGYPDRATTLGEKALATLETLYGTDDPRTFGVRGNLLTALVDVGRVEEAIALGERLLRQREDALGPDDEDTLTVRNNLGLAYSAAGRREDAVRMYEASLAPLERRLGSDHLETLRLKGNLANEYGQLQRIDRAIPLLEELLRNKSERLGVDHVDTLNGRANLGEMYRRAGRTDEAIVMQRETLARLERRFGPEHPATLLTRNNLAAAYMDAHRLEEAIGEFERLVAAHEAKLGADHPSTLIVANNLAMVLFRLGRTREATEGFARVYGGMRARLGEDNAMTSPARDNYVEAAKASGQFSRVIPVLRENYQRTREKTGPSSVRTAGARLLLGEVLLGDEQWGEAVTHLKSALATSERSMPPSWEIENLRSMLGLALAGGGDAKAGEPLVHGGLEGVRARLSEIPPEDRTRRLRDAAARVVRLYELWGKDEEAERWRRRLGAELDPGWPADPFARR